MPSDGKNRFRRVSKEGVEHLRISVEVWGDTVRISWKYMDDIDAKIESIEMPLEVFNTVMARVCDERCKKETEQDR